MEGPEEYIRQAIEKTLLVRQPRQHLATFGVTNMRYYVVTEPTYSDLGAHEAESVVREGKVIVERPAIVTPSYMMNLVGFGNEAREYMEYLARQYGPNSPGLLYGYRNEPGELNIVGGEPMTVAHRIKEDLDRRGDNMAAVIVGVDALWDISLLKFILDFTAASLEGNVQELSSRGLLEPEPELGIPRWVIQRIEELFREVEQGGDHTLLKRELDRWNLFDRYEDQFLGLFRRRFR